jgi:hypothetical protein
LNKALQICLALWTGLFLVLPNCFCQVLVGLGIECHDPVEQHDAVPALEHVLTSPTCHCDDTSLKIAEITPTDDSRVAPTFDFVAIAPQKGSAISPQSALRSASPRAPPGLLTRATQARALTCCWQV